MRFGRVVAGPPSRGHGARSTRADAIRCQVARGRDPRRSSRFRRRTRPAAGDPAGNGQPAARRVRRPRFDDDRQPADGRAPASTRTTCGSSRRSPTRPPSALENGQLEQSLAELSRLKEQLRYQAYHDSLTGLPNRSLFLERWTRASAARPRRTRVPCVLFLDLDDFKIVNDTLGPRGRRPAARRRRRAAPAASCAPATSRPGSAATSSRSCSTTSPTSATPIAVANRIIDALRMPFPIARRRRSSSGRASASPSARRAPRRADELLRNADVAMYTAKARGKSRVGVFEPTMHAAIVARHELRAELARSLGARRARRPLPADRRPRDAADRRRRGARPLAAPDARARRRRTSSSRWPRRPARSCPSVAGCSTRPAARSPPGRGRHGADRSLMLTRQRLGAAAPAARPSSTRSRRAPGRDRARAGPASSSR